MSAMGRELWRLTRNVWQLFVLMILLAYLLIDVERIDFRTVLASCSKWRPSIGLTISSPSSWMNITMKGFYS